MMSCDASWQCVASGRQSGVWRVPAAIPMDICDMACEFARRAPAEPSQLTTHARTHAPTHTVRTSVTVQGPPPQALVDAVHALARREFPSIPMENYEPLQLTRYACGQQYSLHTDGAGVDAANPRIVTILVYLNDVAPSAGGATVFPRLRVSVQPSRGDVVIFFPEAGGDELAHAAAPVLRGEKVVAQLWLRRGPAS